MPLLVGGLLAVTDIFGGELPRHAPLVAAVSHRLEQLLALGVRATVRSLVKTP